MIWKNTCGESWLDTIETGWKVSGKPGAFLFFIPKGEGRRNTYSPPRRGGGISFGNRALCEADAAPAGALWTMSHSCGIAVIVQAVVSLQCKKAS